MKWYRLVVNLTFRKWLPWKWSSGLSTDLLQSYRATFSGPHGTRVLMDLCDRIYCTIYEGKDPNEAAIHNARRSVIQEILELIDQAEHPQKYEFKTFTDGQGVTDALGR